MLPDATIGGNSSRALQNTHRIFRCVQGVVAASWCVQDPALLLSSGKDGRTILWDVSSYQNAPIGQPLGEFSTGSAFSEYVHDVAWSPTNPGLFAAASLGGGENHSSAVSPPVKSYSPACPDTAHP